MVLVAI